MINLILIVGIINYIIYFIFKPDNNILCCGIFGQITNDIAKIDNVSIKMLGIYNESRGKQSCGVFMDNHIEYGLDKLSLFSDFALFNNFVPEKIPIVIGHTRQSSVGAINHHNAHPFGFDPIREGGFRYAGVHNGTLSNHEELAKKYSIEIYSKIEVDGVVSMRTKNDSELLLEMLISTKNYDILSEYIGRAALCWVDTKENITYLWSGKSKTSSYVATLEEERPLNVYIKDVDNFFISSMTDPLFIIGGNDTNIKQIDYNTLYIVKDANFENATKITIDRTLSFIKDFGSYSAFKSPYSTDHMKGYGWGRYDDWDDDIVVTTPNTTIPVIVPQKDTLQLITLDQKVPNSYDVYQEKLRFWENSRLITGCYVWISNFGYYKMTEDLIEFDYLMDNLKDYHFSYLTKNFIKSNDITSYVNTVKLINPQRSFFVQGVKMLTSLDYKITKGLVQEGKHISYEILSHVSEHPVVNISKRKTNIKNQKVLKAGVLFSGMVSGLGFYKTYQFKDGNFIKTISTMTPSTHRIIEPLHKETINDEELFIKTEEFLSTYCAIKKKDTDNEALIKFINEFNETIDDCNDAVIQLKEGLSAYKNKKVMEYDIVLYEITEMLQLYKANI